MKSFRELPVDKKMRIINAGLKIFGMNAYAKASIADIASEAGISKSMIFHYFGTKRAFYFYLMDYSFDLFLDAFSAADIMSYCDFFERMARYAQIEFDLLRQHPHLFKYIMKFYHERDPEVYAGVLEVIGRSMSTNLQMTLEGIDQSKFKEPVDLEFLSRMIRWMAEGLSNQFVTFDDAALNVLENEMKRAMALFRLMLYKEV